MNTASFKSVMEEVMIPYYNSLSGHYIFQQDGATYHTARSVLSFLEDQGVEVMKWPSQSPDLNPIEHIWKMLNKTIAGQLYGEMKEFFPENAVEYFVSYYDIIKFSVLFSPEKPCFMRVFGIG